MPHDMVEKLEADILIYGTGLIPSLVAVGLSSHGIKVILVDPNGDYGSNYRTLNLKNYIIQILNGKELATNSKSDSCDTKTDKKTPNFSCEEENPRFIFNPFDHVESDQNNGDKTLQYNDFHIDLWPKILYSNSLAVTSLLGTGCDNYVQFTAVEGSYVYRNGIFAPIPGTKSAIFRSECFTPLQKRHLYRFLSTLENMTKIPESNEFETGQETAISLTDIIYYGLGRYHDKDKLHNMLKRIKMYISSIGLYGRYYSPFIYPLYGTSDIIQAFARASSLSGTICMLRSKISKGILLNSLSQPDTGENSGKFNFSFTIDTHGMSDSELDLSTTEVSCNILITESHLQDIPHFTNNFDNILESSVNQPEITGQRYKNQLVIPVLDIHIAVLIATEKLLEEGVSTSVILDNSQSCLLQLDASSGTVPLGYYLYYIMGPIECNGGVRECPHLLATRQLFEKNKKQLSSILFASHHNTISDSSVDSANYTNIDNCYNYGMAMTLVDEITMAINVVKKIKTMLPTDKFKGNSEKNDEVANNSANNKLDPENECSDFIYTDKFNKNKDDNNNSWLLDKLTVLVDEYDGYSLEVDGDINSQSQV